MVGFRASASLFRDRSIAAISSKSVDRSTVRVNGPCFTMPFHGLGWFGLVWVGLVWVGIVPAIT